MHCIPSQKCQKEEKHAHFGDAARLYHSYHIFVMFVQSGRCPRVFSLFKSEKLKVKIYRCFGALENKIFMIQIYC